MSSPSPHDKAQYNALFHWHLIVLMGLFFFFLMVQGLVYFHGLAILLAFVVLVVYVLLKPVDLLESTLRQLTQEKLPQLLPTKSYQFLEKLILRGLPHRLLSVMVVFVSAVVLLALLVTLLSPVVGRQVKSFIDLLPTAYTRVAEQLDPLATTSVTIRESAQTKDIQAKTSPPTLAPQPLPILQPLFPFTQKYVTLFAASNVYTLFTSSVTGLIYALTGIVLLFYLLLDGNQLSQGFVWLLPKRLQGEVIQILDNTHGFLKHLVLLQLVSAVLGGALLYLLYTVLHIPFAGFLSLFFGICALLPTIGPWIGLIPSMLILSFQDHPFHLLLTVSLVSIYYFLKDAWLTPAVFNKRDPIHPILMITCFVACIQLLGPLGVALSLPLTCLITACCQKTVIAE